MISITSPGALGRTAQGLAERLQAVFPPQHFSFGYVPARLNQATWKQLTRKTPFVGLGWNDIEANDNTRIFEGGSRWTVFLVTKNTAGIIGQYFGDALAPGLFSMVEGATAALQGLTIEGCDSARVSKASNLYVEGWDSDDMVVAGMDIEVGMTLRLGDVLAGLTQDMFRTLAIEWDFGDAQVRSDTVQVGTT